MMLQSRLWLAASMSIGLLVTGILGYRWLEGFTWLEAFYMTAITLSTVGYREVQPLSPRGEIFTIFLLATGIGVVFYTAVTVAENVVQGEIQQYFGRRRMERRIHAVQGHYIVCGFGRIGEVLCRELASKPVPFVVLEHDIERSHKADALHYLVLQGDATDEALLEEAQIAHARGLFAALPSDADNVFLTLTAKELNPSIFVVSRTETQRTEQTLRNAGADRVVSPYSMGGHRMAQAALRPAVLEIIDLATHHKSLELQIEEIPVHPGSQCSGTTIGVSGLGKKPGTILVAIKRASGEMIFAPADNEIINAGDSLVALAEAERLKEIARMMGS